MSNRRSGDAGETRQPSATTLDSVPAGTLLDAQPVPTRLDAAPSPTRLDQPVPDPSATSEPRVDDTVLLPAALKSRFQIERALPTAGAEADLFLAFDPVGQRQVVIKFYRQNLTPKAEILERLNRLSHEHVVELFEHGKVDGRSFEILEYAQYGSLHDHIGKGPLDPSAVLVELHSALTHLHSHGVVHRDLKPGNILIRSVSPKLDLILADFGIASVSAESVHFTSGNRTILYASPEARDGVISLKSDWWSLGMILLEVLTGRSPFQGLSEALVMSQISTKPIPMAGVTDPRWLTVLKGLLTRDPEKRWGAEEVARWLRGDSVPVHFEGAVRPAASYAPFTFVGESYATPKELAVALGTNWNEALKRMGRGLLRDWIRNTVRDHDLTSILIDLEESRESADLKLARLIQKFDPTLPAMWKGTEVTVETVLALALQTQERPESAGALAELLRAAQSLDVRELSTLDKDAPTQLEAADLTLHNRALIRVIYTLDPGREPVWKGTKVTQRELFTLSRQAVTDESARATLVELVPLLRAFPTRTAIASTVASKLTEAEEYYSGSRVEWGALGDWVGTIRTLIALAPLPPARVEALRQLLVADAVAIALEPSPQGTMRKHLVDDIQKRFETSDSLAGAGAPDASGLQAASNIQLSVIKNQAHQLQLAAPAIEVRQIQQIEDAVRELAFTLGGVIIDEDRLPSVLRLDADALRLAVASLQAEYVWSPSSRLRELLQGQVLSTVSARLLVSAERSQLLSATQLKAKVAQDKKLVRDARLREVSEGLRKLYSTILKPLLAAAIVAIPVVSPLFGYAIIPCGILLYVFIYHFEDEENWVQLIYFFGLPVWGVLSWVVFFEIVPSWQAEADRVAKEAERKRAIEERFVANGDGTVTDRKVGVIWADRDNGSNINWNSARQYCAGKGDGWQLPTMAQLKELYKSRRQLCRDWSCGVPPLVPASRSFFWSSESFSSEARVFGLENGHEYSTSVNDVVNEYAVGYRALCVRTEPPPEVADVITDNPEGIAVQPPAPPAPPPDGPREVAPSVDMSMMRARPPRYPPQMLRRGIQGEVMLRILVSADGRLEKIEIERSSGHREFDRSAMQAAKNWRFNAGVRDGAAFAGWALVPVRFTLAD